MGLRREEVICEIRTTAKGSAAQKNAFLLSLNHFENNFIEKVRYLTSNPKGKTTEKFGNARLDSMTKTMGVRMSMRFFILWLVLRGISYEQLKEAHSEAQAKIDKVFSVLKVSGALERFEQVLTET